MSGMPAFAVTRIPCAPHALLARAARDIVERERENLPVLSGSVVLVPDPHAIADVAHALRDAAGAPALLLPRITTLALWAAEVPAGRPLAARAAREAMLYRELKSRAWLEGADLWAVAAELVGLFDEMTRHGVSLPADFEAFNRQLAAAYRARSGASLTFEARLVHELWHAMARVAGEADPESAYQLRLARIAGQAQAPLYALALSRLAPCERLFLERYGERAPVRVFEPEFAEPGDPIARTLAAAWPRDTGAGDLLARGRALAAAYPRSALAGRIRIVGAAGAEEEAQLVDATVRGWLLEGRRPIGIVVADRLVARRARALLERGEVLVKDEAGWAFSTTSAATVIGRWLDVAGEECYYRDLLDLLKSPFVFHDWPRESRREAVWRLERYIRRENVVAGLTGFIALAEEENDGEVRRMLTLIRRGAAALGRRARPIARWLADLGASLEEIGVRGGLAADPAGAQLVELIERLAGELAAVRLDLDFAEFRRWLSRELEGATFRDRAIDSPVVFTSLGATRLRRFDAALVLGADAAHLPGADPVAMFFNQGVRAELALPTWAERVREMEDDLAALIASSPAVVVTWQRHAGGEENLLSPMIERLAAVHTVAYGFDLRVDADSEFLAASAVRSPGGGLPQPPTAVPAPSVPDALLPRRISASGYNSLLACPYQFHARYVLRLAELDDVQEMIEKKDYGSVVHRVLAAFHRAHPRVLELDPAAAARELEALSEREFAEAVARNYLARAWLARWRALIPSYVEWQRGREREGWAWIAGEEARAVEIVTPAGNRFVLNGRLDRIDESARGVAVVDYKTADPQRLRRALDTPGEDVQLPVYALLAGAAAVEAIFLSLDREGVQPVALTGEVQPLAHAVRARLAELFDALAAGAALPAQGSEAACEWCEARGLCRRNYWP